MVSREGPHVTCLMRLKIIALFYIIGCSLLLLMPYSVGARELSPTSPTKVLLQLSGGIITVEENVAVQNVAGQSTCQVLLPPGASHVRVLVPGKTILTWAQRPQSFKRKNAAAAKRTALESRLNEIDIALILGQQRLDLWNHYSNNCNYEDLESIDKKKLEIVPKLLAEQKSLKTERKQIEKELKALSEVELVGSLVTVTLAQNVTTPTVLVRYSYFLSNCGWKPHYTFSIEPEQAKSELQVRFLADVWQSSGIDWQNTAITLVSGAQGQREPPNLANWLIRTDLAKSVEKRRNSYDRLEDTMVSREAPMAMSSAALKAPSYAEHEVDTSGIYATWQLANTYLAEGRIEMLIQERTLPANLVWLARPNRSAGDVFLSAKSTLPADAVWPRGNAVYIVQGQEVGQGVFNAKGKDLTLYFGQDPRVRLEVVQDKTQRGQTGFFGRDNTWAWGWTYIIHNMHNKSVKVRLERPEPRAVDADIKISLTDKPRAQIDSKKHVLFWEMDVAAGQEMSIYHSLMIKAPEKMSLSPNVP